MYAVLSRRSRGISVGVNLNPDKVCNWDCVYCQVDRTVPSKVRTVDLNVLGEELRTTLALARTGQLYDLPLFAEGPAELRRLADIAFAGDGEPTSFPSFDEAVRTAIEAKRATGWTGLRIVVLTNATLLDRPSVRRGCDLLAEDGGEIWAKLDAGTEAFFRQVDRPHHSLSRCVELIAAEARRVPIVIQSLFMRVNGDPPPPAEIDAYIERLRFILDAGGRIRLVQVTTVARRPAEPSVSMIDDVVLDAIGEGIRAALPGLAVETYYGVAGPYGPAPGGVVSPPPAADA